MHLLAECWAFGCPGDLSRLAVPSEPWQHATQFQLTIHAEEMSWENCWWVRPFHGAQEGLLLKPLIRSLVWRCLCLRESWDGTVFSKGWRMGKAAKLEIAGTPVSLDLTHGIQGVCSTAGQLWLMVRGGEGTGKEEVRKQGVDSHKLLTKWPSLLPCLGHLCRSG